MSNKKVTPKQLPLLWQQQYINKDTLTLVLDGRSDV